MIYNKDLLGEIGEGYRRFDHPSLLTVHQSERRSRDINRVMPIYLKDCLVAGITTQIHILPIEEATRY